MIKEEVKLTKFQYLLLYFFIYSFVGWLMETVFAFSIAHTFVKRGFLFGPLCPIYGYGAVMLITILDRYKNKKVKLFFMAILVFTVFEYISGFGLDALFGLKWWDYTYDFLNLNRKSCCFLFSSLGNYSSCFYTNDTSFCSKNFKKSIKKNITSTSYIYFKYILCNLDFRYCSF